MQAVIATPKCYPKFQRPLLVVVCRDAACLPHFAICVLSESRSIPLGTMSQAKAALRSIAPEPVQQTHLRSGGWRRCNKPRLGECGWREDGRAVGGVVQEVIPAQQVGKVQVLGHGEATLQGAAAHLG